MTDDTTIIRFRQPGSINYPLTEIARDGARRMLMAALKAEADSFVAQFSEDRLADGRQRVVRHGAGPERGIQTGIGPIEVRRQKVRDRAPGLPVEAKISFTSNIRPKWARRSKSLDALLPALYLRGIATGDFQEALSAILGTDAPNLTPGVISRLTGCLAGGLRPLAAPGSLGPPLRLHLGGWGLPAGADGTRSRMYPGDHRGDA